MRFPEGMTTPDKDDLSRGFDHGNYGNAYESQDWEAWRLADDDDEEHDAEWSPAFLRGALLGFFSSYELDEIADPVLADEVRALRMRHDDDACGTCGASLPDDYLRAHPYLTRVRACPDGCKENDDDDE